MSENGFKLNSQLTDSLAGCRFLGCNSFILDVSRFIAPESSRLKVTFVVSSTL